MENKERKQETVVEQRPIRRDRRAIPPLTQAGYLPSRRGYLIVDKDQEGSKDILLRLLND